MSNPSREQKIAELQKHIRFLLNQPLQDFQEQQGVKIDRIEFDMIDLSTVGDPKCFISKVILRISE